MLEVTPRSTRGSRTLLGSGLALPALDALGGPTGRPLIAGICVAALAVQVASLTFERGWRQDVLGLMALVLVAVALLLMTAVFLRWLLRRSRMRVVAGIVEADQALSVVADEVGRILTRNRVARDGGDDRKTVAALLRSFVAEPDDLVASLRRDARAQDGIVEVALGPDEDRQLSVRPVGPGIDLWRLDRRIGVEPGTGTLPALILGASGEVLSVNAAFRHLAGEPPAHIDSLLLDPPLMSGHVHLVRSLTGPVERLVAQVEREGGGSEVYLLPWDRPGVPAGAGWDAIEELPVPLLRVAPTGLILAANRHARVLLPNAGEDGVRLSDLLEGLGRPLIEWVADVAEGRPTLGPQFLRGTGPQQDTTLRVSLSLGGPPGDRAIIAVLDDVTEFKAIEAQFVQSQKMQALGQLAGGVAHDFNNLLTAISGHCDLLFLRHDHDDPDYADLTQIRQNVNRAASLVAQLLAFSRKQSLMPEIIDLRIALADLTHLLNRLVGERVRLTLDHDSGVECIRADKRQFEQVVMNLVVNARDAMPDGGEIRIETGNRDVIGPLTLDRATIPPGRYVIVRVIDEGTGIPPERLPKIFEPFYTTKKPGEGTGLGLSTAYGIVKQSGGYIFADSEVGRGTSFTLWFPAHGKPPAAIPSPASAASVERRAEGVILLVEDEVPVRTFAARALQMRGYTVLEADSGEAALAVLADYAGGVDLILSDVILPDMDGPTWVRKALLDRPEAQVIFVSGYAEESFSEQKALIPGSIFLPKPFSLVELTSTVHRHLSRNAKSDS